MQCDSTKPWYHGSPCMFDYLLSGSTITQDYDLARIFSHKPTVVCLEISDDGEHSRKHSGVEPGFLYQVDEVLRDGDIVPVPGSTLPAGQEWHTTRPLRVRCMHLTTIDVSEQLTDDEIAELSPS